MTLCFALFLALVAGCLVLGTAAGVVPWAIACSVPLAVLGADLRALGYAFLLWLIPLCYLGTKRYFFKEVTL